MDLYSLAWSFFDSPPSWPSWPSDGSDMVSSKSWLEEAIFKAALEKEDSVDLKRQQLTAQPLSEILPYLLFQFSYSILSGQVELESRLVPDCFQNKIFFVKMKGVSILARLCSRGPHPLKSTPVRKCSSVQVERLDDFKVMTIGINRPDKRNSVNKETANLLYEAFDQFEQDLTNVTKLC